MSGRRYSFGWPRISVWYILACILRSSLKWRVGVAGLHPAPSKKHTHTRSFASSSSVFCCCFLVLMSAQVNPTSTVGAIERLLLFNSRRGKERTNERRTTVNVHSRQRERKEEEEEEKRWRKGEGNLSGGRWARTAAFHFLILFSFFLSRNFFVIQPNSLRNRPTHTGGRTGRPIPERERA